ncbi:MAG: ParB/RepB/Spo0J family partition protein [Bacteroidales bacterium]|nr:MAG: ParB/RepB/Spo0J family partition protein [Bacteroidales bacterium]
MARKNALGRGLGALIDDADREKYEKIGSINEIDIGMIEVNPFQPRAKIHEESLNELASSIRQLGIIQPLTIRQIRENKFQLITGERRLKAAIIAGLKTIPAYIRTADDQAMLELALVENIQREDLDAIEVAISYQRLIEECNLTQENLSDRVGKKRSTISNYLRLLRLPAEIQLGIREKKIGMGHARTLINIDNPKIQIDAYYRILEEELSVRRVEDIVRELNRKADRDQSMAERKRKLNNDFVTLQEHLKKFFNTDVQFRVNEKGRGKIVIPFETTEEMERIIGIFDKLNA